MLFNNKIFEESYSASINKSNWFFIIKLLLVNLIENKIRKKIKNIKLI